MGGGVSIGPGSPLRSIGQEWPQINQLFNSDFSGQNSALQRYGRKSPLLNQANNQALNFSGGVNGLIGQLGQDQSALGGLFSSLGNISSSLGGLLPELGRGLNTVNETVNSGGALTSDQTRQVNQDTAAQFASRGALAGNQSIVTDVMNLQNARDARFANALNEQGQLTGEISGIRGQQAGIRGAQAGIIGARAGLTGETQNLQTGALNQLEQTQGANVGTFSTLSDPLLNFANSLFSGNQFASLSTQIANQNKGAGVAGGGISGVGGILQSIISAIPFSDRRLKEKIRSTGEKTPGGTPIKSFQYKGNPQRFIGVIAQDALKHEPHAVRRGPGGFLGVDHGMIGAPFHAIAGRGSEGGEGNIHLAYFGPVAGDRNPDANFALHGSGPGRDRHGRRSLAPHDIALSPDLLRHHPLGSNVTIHGNRYHVADVSYKHPGSPNKNTIEFRDSLHHPNISLKDILREPGNIARTIGRTPGRVGRTITHIPGMIGHRRGGMPLGRSGYPRAIPVSRRGGRRGARGGGDPYGNFGGGAPFSAGGNPISGDPGGAPIGDPFGGSPQGDPTVAGGSPIGQDTPGGGSPYDWSNWTNPPDTGGVPLMLDPNAEWMGDGSQFGGDLIHLMLNG